MAQAIADQVTDLTDQIPTGESGGNACNIKGVGDLSKFPKCIKQTTDKIDEAFDEIKNIDDRIETLVVDKVKQIVPIDEISKIIETFSNPKSLFEPLCDLLYELTGIVICNEVEKKATISK